jgi:riboflavin synthase
MFTGLVQAVGTLTRTDPIRGGGCGFDIDAGGMPLADVRDGESIAVNGVCLTVTSRDASSFRADLSAETLACTTLGELSAGAPLNLERALRADDRLGGHLVTGHVDAVGHILSWEMEGGCWRWRIAAPQPLHRYLARKGSVTVDGVSLTINEVDAQGFSVNLIPHTIENTSFRRFNDFRQLEQGTRPVGARVNLEVDLVARYIERMLELRER